MTLIAGFRLMLGCLCLTTSVASPYAPTNVRFRTLDFNISITWNPPLETKWQNETILYTVTRWRGDVAVSSCVNMTSTICNLMEVFPSVNKIKEYEYFRVKSNSDVRVAFRGSTSKAFTVNAVIASAPVITNVKISSSNVTIALRGPETPYIKKGRPLFLVEESLFKKLPNIYFNWSLIMPGDPHYFKLEDPKMSKDGTARVRITSLTPYRRYIFRVSSRLNNEFSPSFREAPFQTLQEAPRFGPIVLNHRVIKRTCDLRDVYISWKVRYDSVRQGPLTRLYLTYNSTSKNVKNWTVSLSDHDITLPDLSRWNKYDVIVTSENSGGYHSGDVYTIDEDDHDTRSYVPSIRYITKTSDKDYLLMWDPPKNHQPCIQGYEVAIYNEGQMEALVTVSGSNTTMVALRFEDTGRYNIKLSPIVTDKVKTSVSTSTTYDIKDPQISDLPLLGLVLILVVIAISAVVVTIKKLCCDVSDIPDFSLTKSVAQLFGDQSYTLRSPPEKELFHRTKPSESYKSVFTGGESPTVDANQDDTKALEQKSLTEKLTIEAAFGKQYESKEEDKVLRVDIPRTTTTDYVRHCLMSTESADSGFWTAPYDGSFPESVFSSSPGNEINYESIPVSPTSQNSSRDSTSSTSDLFTDESNPNVPPVSDAGVADEESPVEDTMTTPSASDGSPSENEHPSSPSGINTREKFKSQCSVSSSVLVMELSNDSNLISSSATSYDSPPSDSGMSASLSDMPSSSSSQPYTDMSYVTSSPVGDHGSASSYDTESKSENRPSSSSSTKVRSYISASELDSYTPRCVDKENAGYVKAEEMSKFSQKDQVMH